MQQISRMLQMVGLLQSPLRTISVLVVHLLLVQFCSGQSQLIGSRQPIVATIGDDIILPCHLEPAMDVAAKTLEWTKTNLDPRFVYLWRASQDVTNIKNPSYRGRTSLFTGELKHGNISLKLSKVTPSDEGSYRCFIPNMNTDAFIQLVVASDAVSSPVISLTGIDRNRGGVVLQCESEGWYPEPEVLWLDAEGHVLSAGPTETVRGPDGLYTVSSRVTVEERHRNNFTCRVQQKDINQTRETQIHVPDHFFVVAPHTPGTPGTTSTPGTPGGLPAILVCAVFVLTVVFLVWKIRRQKRLRNKRRGLEDGPEQTDKEKTVASKGDETIFHVMNEGEESVPLMATREEENNLDNTGQEEMKSQSEHEEVAERETNQDQLVINPEMKRDKDSAEGGVEIKFINNEKAPLISAEGETHQRQDMIGRQVKSDLEKDEGEQTKPAKEDSGLSVVVVVEEQKEQLQNLHTDQEEEKEEETQQEQVTHQKKAKEKKKNVKPNVYKQEKTKKERKVRQMKEQREQKLPEEERQREENKKKHQSELQKRKEKEKDEMKLKSQEGDGGHHLLEDKEQERSEAEVRGKKEEDQKGNHNDCSGMTGRKVENQEEEMNEKVKETGDRTVENVGELQSERPEQIKRTVEGNGNQHVLDTNKQEAEDEGKKGRDREENQSDITTERDVKRNENEKLKETRQEKKDERENKPPAVSSEVTERLDLSIQETQQQEFQEETKHQAEKQQEEKSVRNQGETKELLEQSIKGDDTDESQKMSKETGQKLGEVGQLQVVQQAGVKEEIREQPEGSSTCPAETRAECREEKAVESNRRPTTGPTQRNVRRRTKQQHNQGNQHHVDQQREVKKRKREEEEVQTPETFKKSREEHLLEDKEQERSEAEVRGKVENMGELQSERPEQIMRTEEGNGNQHVLDTNKQEAEVEDQQREVEERKHQEDDEVQTLETCESEEEQMGCEEAVDTEQQVIDESEHMDCSTEVDQEHLFQDEQMDF